MKAVGIELAGVEVQADEWSEECSTAIENVSAYVVVVSSVLRSRAVTLISSYLANLSGTTAVSHLRTCATLPPVFSQRILEVMPGQTHARACLLDHAAELHGLLDELLPEEEVTVEVSDGALEQAARVWSSPPRLT
jgi:hypothetical protein